MYVCGIRSSFLHAALPPAALTLELLPTTRSASQTKPPHAWHLTPEPPPVPFVPKGIARLLTNKPRRGQLHVPVPATRTLVAALPKRGNGSVLPVLLPTGLFTDLPFALHFHPPLPAQQPVPVALRFQLTREVRYGPRLMHYPSDTWLTLPTERILLHCVRCTPRLVTLHGYLARDPRPAPLEALVVNSPLQNAITWAQRIVAASPQPFAPEAPAVALTTGNGPAP